MRDLKFICAQPDDTYFTWQVHLWLESLRKLGHSDKAIVLVFTPGYRQFNEKWKRIEALYPEAEFAYIDDRDNISNLISIYIPIIRPYSLMRYWETHPEMEKCAVMYCDCDVYFTDNFNVDHLLEDDICYLSDTNSYINADYFDSKVRDVLPEKLIAYKQLDVLDEALRLVGIYRSIAEKNNLNSGGAQYLLKNIDISFWAKMTHDTIAIRKYLLDINGQYFESENKGFQSWCADMWSLLWGLWYKGLETRCVPEMEFSWATDPIDKVERLGIFHNAGVVANVMDNFPYFYKGNYHTGQDPLVDPHLEKVIKENPDKGTAYYTTKLLNIKQKYNLNY